MRYLKLLPLLAFCCFKLQAQTLDKNKQYNVAVVGFWNVENLYDTLNDQWKNDEDFTPDGVNAWSGPRYRQKLEHLSDVISQMGTDANPDGLAILGLCEIENKSVVQDLVNTPKLKARNYQIVHVEGPDARGVDPSFIYNPKYFKVTAYTSYHVKYITDTTHKTRDQLVVSGLLNGEPVTVIVNHWPSRRGGEMKSRPNRISAAESARRITDSIVKADPKAKVIIMGDLNDDPTSKSVKKYLNTSGDFNNVKDGQLFNAMENYYIQGTGTLAWDDAWNLFDQIIMTKPFVKGDYKDWQYYTARIFNKPFVKQEYGNFKGYPLRTYAGGVYTAGYSDHFAVYVLLMKELVKK
ncbi:MAG: endonuclease/exonuclease/phosphatase family protein [Bacteroidetes bacterium]|nr:endonuclease/exonuclease/phosphatase family protein [Bacteroidota bacterium]